MEIGDVTIQPATSDGQAAGVNLADTFDDFLLLLTTQLENQDPLSPLDPNQFTEQLVQFADVEQAINTNRKLDDLIALQNTNQLTAALDFIGKSVEVDGIGLHLSGGAARITYELPSNAADTTIQIFDASGQAVRTISAASTAGSHELTWDGTDDFGNDLADGLYTFSVTASDGEGGFLPTAQGTIGGVTGIELVDGEVILSIGPLQVPLSQITAIRDDGAGDDGQA